MLKRIGIYLNEMFPASAIIGSILTAVAVQLVYLRLYDLRPESVLPLIVPALVLTFVSLLIRIMDEFKDYQDDLTNFPMRPLPSGRVFKKDLVALGFFCVFCVIFLSLTSTKLLIWALLTLGFAFLMLKWFFIEDIMRKNLPLAFVTHHPIVLFNFVYLLIACTHVDPAIDFVKAVYILPICLIFTNWEIVRKVRAPEQETGYTTYSKIFGPRPAIVIALVLQIIFTGTVFAIFEQLHTPDWLKIVFGAVQIILISPSLYFLLTLKLRKPLRPFAEAQILVVVGSLFVAALL
jgi:4-hydroxybenzoate polyprenyltransferase